MHTLKNWLRFITLVLSITSIFILSNCGSETDEGFYQDEDQLESVESTDDLSEFAPEVVAATEASATINIRSNLTNEMKYALSKSRMDGQSSASCSGWTVADWDYVNDTSSWLPQKTKNCLTKKYGSSTGSYGYWRNKCDNNYVYMGHGGYCKFFVDLMLMRAGDVDSSSNPRYSLPSWGSMKGKTIDNSLSPGDVIFKYVPGGTSHIAVVYSILSTDGSGRPTQVDVVDSNYINGNGQFILGKHKISSSGDFYNYLIWTNNSSHTCSN